MQYYKSLSLKCFSPPVMIVTLLIEIACLIYVVWRYKLTPMTRVVALMLACLAFFQLAEFNVCEGAWGINSAMWARLGFVSITFLPPLGIHLASLIARGRTKWLVWLGYAVAISFAVFFLTANSGVESNSCQGNYVIFALSPWATTWYTLYYYGWLLLGIAVSLAWTRGIKETRTRYALQALAFGYLSFLVPTTIANIIDPTTMAGIPSIMCGFAVILALVVTFVVLPRSVHLNGR